MVNVWLFINRYHTNKVVVPINSRSPPRVWNRMCRTGANKVVTCVDDSGVRGLRGISGDGTTEEPGRQPTPDCSFVESARFIGFVDVLSQYTDNDDFTQGLSEKPPIQQGFPQSQLIQQGKNIPKYPGALVQLVIKLSWIGGDNFEHFWRHTFPFEVTYRAYQEFACCVRGLAVQSLTKLLTDTTRPSVV